MKVRLKRLVLMGLATLGYLLGLPLWKKMREARAPGRLRVLRYHSVSSTRTHETAVRPKDFQRQMRWLNKHHRVIDPDDILMRQGESAVMVTLDDGYADNYYEALPVLRTEGIRALIFLVAGYAGTDNLLPHDAGGSVEANRLLRWEEIRDCDPRCVEFGSHGWSHRRLSTIADDAQIAQEVTWSKERIEKEWGRPVRFFSFPFGVEGDYDARTTRMVREAGYKAAFNAKYGENSQETNAFDLFRIGVERSDNLFTLRSKLNGALDLLPMAETPVGRRAVRWMNRMVGA